MTLILAIRTIDSSGNEDLIFASDGRVVKHTNNKKEIVNEDEKKIRKLTPKICIGYAGQNAILFEDVFDKLKDEIQKMKNKDLMSVKNRLRILIEEMLNTEKYKEVEEKVGPLIHQFIIGGSYRGKIKLRLLKSINRFKTKKIQFPPSEPICCDILGSTDKIQQKAGDVYDEQMREFPTIDGIIKDIAKISRYIISETAKLHPNINNHVFIRKLSKNFDLETYIGRE
jgi:hypothetical protein